ncbi:ABC transporter ATP-binding protein [soil metagenome]
MSSSSHPVLRLTRRLRPIKWQAAGAYGAMFAASGIALVVPLALRDVIDAAIGERPEALGFLPDGLGDRQRLIAGAGMVVLLALVRAVVSFWQRYGTAWVGRTVATDLRRDLMAHLLDSEMAFHDRARVGQLMTRVTDDTEQVRAFAATGVADMANIAALLVGTSVLLWGIDPALAPYALGAVPLVAVIAVIGARMLVPRFKALQKSRGGLSAHLQESLTQVRVVQAFHAEPRTAARYDADNEIVYGHRIGLARIFTSVFPGMTAILGFTTALVLLVGGGRVAEGQTSVGTIVAFTAYIVLLGEPVRRLGFLLNLAARASASASRVFELLDRPPAMPLQVGQVPEGGWSGGIRWEGVTFGYGDTPVLRDVDLTIRPGEHVAIVGRSGSGKTALVSLLVRLYDPDAGRVTLDGTDIADLTRQTLQQAVAAVEQDAFLFSASVADNIAFARPDATAEEIRAAAVTAGAHDFVTRLDEGYDTIVGERGVTLSGGQRQRLALARALLVGAPVLVLDDAVSAVDARTERAIRTALARSSEGALTASRAAGPTVISVAQRLSTILAADRIVVLDGGRVVEQGTHEQLIDAEGPYAALFRDTLLAVAGEVDAAVATAVATAVDTAVDTATTRMSPVVGGQARP